MPTRRRRKDAWTPEEIKRFEDLSVLKNDEKGPLDAKIKAAKELERWLSEMAVERRVEGLIHLAKNATSAEAKIEANGTLLRLTREETHQKLCTVFLGLSYSATCSICGKELAELHSVSEHPGEFCAGCCPGCSIVPKELIEEIDMTSTLENLVAEYGGSPESTQPWRQVFHVVLRNKSNTSSRPN